MVDEKETVCKPFKKRHEEQLKLVSSFDWISFSALGDIHDLIVSVLSDEKAVDYLESNCVRVIADLAAKRIRELESFAQSAGNHQADTTENDVEKNVAAAYNVESAN